LIQREITSINAFPSLQESHFDFLDRRRMPGVNTRYVSGGLKRVHWAFVIPIKVSAVDSDAVPKAAQNIPQAVNPKQRKTCHEIHFKELIFQFGLNRGIGF
jgi:hypothetical protein